MCAQYSNKNHFPEQFEDSEAMQSQTGEYGGMPDQETGEPIQLIRIRPSGQVEIDQKALDIISSCDMPVGFVTIAGKYRTGKSFLLNKLLYLEGKGFRVDPSTSACTEGIWMWSKPYRNDRLGNYIFFLDTEGSQSLTKDVENDTKIFVLASLLSSYFIYNSVGSIDEKSISELNVVTKLSMNVLAEQNISARDNEETLYRYMPKFMWLLRDFTLELRNRQSPADYLEDCLLEQNTLIRLDEHSRKVRRALVNYFKERDCMVMVRPARQERDLQRLDQIPEHALRREFVDSVNVLREKIMRQTGPKTYEGTPLFGSSLASMLESYVESINSSGFPTIKTAWEHISDDQGAFAYNRALQTYNEQYEEYFQEDEPKGEQIHKILMNLRDNTLNEFNRNISQPNEAYYNKLRQFLSNKQQAIMEVNKQLNQTRNVEILKQCVEGLKLKLESNHYQGNSELFSQDIEKVTQEYKKRAKGENKGEILSQFLTNINPIVLEMTKGNNDNSVNDQVLKQIEERLKLQQIQNKKLQSDLNNAKNQKQKTVMDAKNQIKVLQERLKKSQNKSTGCCGGGNCMIM